MRTRGRISLGSQVDLLRETGTSESGALSRWEELRKFAQAAASSWHDWARGAHYRLDLENLEGRKPSRSQLRENRAHWVFFHGINNIVAQRAIGACKPDRTHLSSPPQGPQLLAPRKSSLNSEDRSIRRRGRIVSGAGAAKLELTRRPPYLRCLQVLTGGVPLALPPLAKHEQAGG